MIDKNIFGNVLEHPSQISVTELAELSEALARCPSSTILRTLVWMGSRVCIPQFSVDPTQLELHLIDPDYVARQLAPLHAPYLQDDAHVLSQSETQPDIQAVPLSSDPEPSSQRSDSHTEDIMNEINSYHDISFKTAPKSVILSNFLETANCKIDDSEPTPATPVEELAKKSISFDESLCTETLAVVLEKQGKFEKAVAVYEKLMCKYPEKSSTFAVRIEALKNNIVNK